VRRLIVLGAAALVLAAPAAAATPQQRIAKLEAQVKALTAQVKTLQSAERHDRSEISANYTGDACQASIVADLFQSTFAAIDQGSATPKFSTEPQADDRGACKSMGVTRPGITTKPTIFTVITALIKWAIG
jgi:hypothetical protein